MARVTVVNDNAEFLGLMKDLLLDAGHAPTPIAGEMVTIEGVADTEPDLLIVDLVLHDAAAINDGWALVVGGRAHPRLAHVPIVLCTADAEFLRNRADEISALADIHPLPKPFHLGDVEALLDRLLHRKSA